LVTSLQETALDELELRLESGDVLLSSTPVLHQVLEATYTPALGEPADQLELTLQLEFQIPYATGADMYQLGRSVLDRRIPEDFIPQPETLRITQLTDPESQGVGSATWKIEASWKLGATLNEPQAVALVLGLKPEQATQHLSNEMPIQGIPEIQLTPDWWPRLPILPFRIQLINPLAIQSENTLHPLVDPDAVFEFATREN
jgi:hypothetical protein